MRDCALAEIRVYNTSVHVFAEHRGSNMIALIQGSSNKKWEFSIMVKFVPFKHKKKM